MTDHDATVTSAEACLLGEGPVWDGERGRLLWVDIVAGAVLEGVVDGDEVVATARHSFGGTVGAVVAATDGTLLVAAREGLVRLALDGTRTDGPRVVETGTPSRLNDGAVDPAGRFLVGTFALTEKADGERLVRLETDGCLTVLDSDLSLSNGLAWSPDSSTMYSVDTLRGVVWSRDYDAATGAVGPRRVHLSLPGELPDGICVDETGALWVAVWGAGQVRRFSEAGVLVDVVRVPVARTSSVAFVGPDLDLLLITTASADLTRDQLEQSPLAGRLFTARVDVVGLPATPWVPTPLSHDPLAPRMLVPAAPTVESPVPETTRQDPSAPRTAARP